MQVAIGDIHGCAKTLEALVEKINPGKEDTLYLLGDFINKGPNSKGVLDYIMRLKENGLKVEGVRGNHDQKLLDVRKGNMPGKWLHDPQLTVTLDSFDVDSPFDIPQKYLDFLESLPYYIELDNFFLVHAGFNFLTRDIFIDKPAMMDIKHYQLDKERLRGKRILQGHIPVKTEITNELASSRAQVIKLDTGCPYYHTEGMGVLTGLNLDSFDLFFQENIDAPYSGGRYR
jgi:serine/threonine protein phosphatase 1